MASDSPNPSSASTPPVLAVAAAPSYPAPARRSPWVVLLLVFLILFLGGSLLVNLVLLAALGVAGAGGETRVRERYYSHQPQGAAEVAIIDISGVIIDAEPTFKGLIDHARGKAGDGKLKAVVLRINSPGGSVSGSDYIFHQLKKFREETGVPLVVSMGAVAASGGYYSAMAVGDAPESIFAEPSTFTGSIGVVIPHYNIAGLLDKLGIEADSIASHPLKTMGSMSRPMTDEERALFKALIDEGLDQFKEVIRFGRPRFRDDPAALDRLATGQVFSARQALKAGLIDRIGFLDDAVARAIELARLDRNDVRVVRYAPETNLWELLGAQSRQTKAADPRAWLDALTPQPYYLWTAMPLPH